MKTLILFLLLSTVVNSQNFEHQFYFKYFYEYDFDFNKSEEVIPYPTEILFKVENGKGLFHMYVSDKSTYFIDKYYTVEGGHQFEMRNQSGTQFIGLLIVNSHGYASKFILKCVAINKGFCLY